METFQLTEVKYCKVTTGDGNLNVCDTARVIIPTDVPSPNVKALDVTHLTPEERQTFLALLREYNEYVARQMKTIFSLEDWAHHSGQSIDPKWRTFKIDQLTEL